jgi:hypothetical protein
MRIALIIMGVLVCTPALVCVYVYVTAMLPAAILVAGACAVGVYMEG